MNSRLVMDKARRVEIPKALREEFHLEPGDSLELDSDGEQITLRPVPGAGLLQNKHGIWVLHTGEALAASVTGDLLRKLREERDLSNRGRFHLAAGEALRKKRHRVQGDRAPGVKPN